MIKKIHKAYRSIQFLSYGDAYGQPFEYDGLKGETFAIDELPDEPIGVITDDSKMAQISFDNVKDGRLNIENIKKQYIKWAETDGAKDGIGLQTRSALLEGRFKKNGQGNGSLMRCIPYMLLLSSNGASKVDIFNEMKKESSLTHINSEVFELNMFFFEVALNGIEFIEYYKNKTITFKFKEGHTAWMYHTAWIVAKALKKDFKSVIDGFKYITSKGGDTDTNCAIYGAVYGAISDEVLSFNKIDIDCISFSKSYI